MVEKVQSTSTTSRPVKNSSSTESSQAGGKSKGATSAAFEKILSKKDLLDQGKKGPFSGKEMLFMLKQKAMPVKAKPEQAKGLAGPGKLKKPKKQEPDQLQPGQHFQIPRVFADQSLAVKPAREAGKVSLSDGVVDEIVASARIIKQGDATAMEIQIKTDVFDDLNLRITAEEGGIRAEFLTDNPQLKGMIKDSLPDLEQALVNRGLEILNIAVNEKEVPQQKQKQQQEQQHHE